MYLLRTTYVKWYTDIYIVVLRTIIYTQIFHIYYAERVLVLSETEPGKVDVSLPAAYDLFPNLLVLLAVARAAHRGTHGAQQLLWTKRSTTMLLDSCCWLCTAHTHARARAHTHTQSMVSL